MTKLCECSEYNPKCARSGVPMEQLGIRAYELCSGRCPVERPCPEGASEKIRARWDNDPIVLPPLPDGSITVSTSTPSLISQAGEFLEIYADWVKRGKPRRTPEAVEAIRAICRKCDLFDKIGGNCIACGCGMTKPRAMLNVVSVLTLGIVEAITAPEMDGTVCPKDPPLWGGENG